MDKQIMIDGVDVWECIDFSKKDKVSCCHLLYDKCYEKKDCYFKQLARKTQECEKLKGKLRKLELKNTTLQNRYQQLDGSITECDRYRKALEEIEELITDGRFIRCSLNDDVNCNYFTKNKILDIINKAKGGEDE